MQGLRTETLEDRAATLRSAQLPLRMAAAAVVLAQALAAPPQAVLVVANVQKEIRTVLRQHTARAEGVVVARQQA